MRRHILQALLTHPTLYKPGEITIKFGDPTLRTGVLNGRGGSADTARGNYINKITPWPLAPGRCIIILTMHNLVGSSTSFQVVQASGNFHLILNLE